MKKESNADEESNDETLVLNLLSPVLGSGSQEATLND